MISFGKFLKDTKFSVSPGEDKLPFVCSLYYPCHGEHTFEKLTLRYVSQSDMRRIWAIDEYLSQTKPTEQLNDFFTMVEEIDDKRFSSILNGYPGGKERAIEDLIANGSLAFAEKYNKNQTRISNEQTQKHKEQTRSLN